MQLKNPFNIRLQKHQEALERFKLYLRQQEFESIRETPVQTENGAPHRDMNQYLNQTVQNVLYTPDLGALKDGEGYSFDIKASYFSKTRKFSIEFASIHHAISNGIIIIGERKKSEFLYLYPENATLFWDIIYLPTFSWRWTNKDMQILQNWAKTHYPTKQVEWKNLVEPQKASGTPFVLITASKFSTDLKIIHKHPKQTKQSILGDFYGDS